MRLNLDELYRDEDANDHVNTVMFRIVEDTEPPIPETFSPLLDDFLRQCFQKDPRERPHAEILCEHEWLKNWGFPKVCFPLARERTFALIGFGSGTAPTR